MKTPQQKTGIGSVSIFLHCVLTRFIVSLFCEIQSCLETHCGEEKHGTISMEINLKKRHFFLLWRMKHSLKNNNKKKNVLKTKIGLNWIYCKYQAYHYLTYKYFMIGSDNCVSVFFTIIFLSHKLNVWLLGSTVKIYSHSTQLRKQP